MQRYPWETGSCSATQEIPRHLCQVEGSLPVCNSSLLDLIMRQINEDQILYTTHLNSVLILSPQIYAYVFKQYLRVQNFLTKILYQQHFYYVIFLTQATYNAACILFKIRSRHCITWLVFFVVFFCPFKQIPRYLDHDKLNTFSNLLVTVTQSFDSIQCLNYRQSRWLYCKVQWGIWGCSGTYMDIRLVRYDAIQSGGDLPQSLQR